MLTRKLKTDLEVGVQKLSHDCAQQLLPLCSMVPANCTLDYEERTGKLLGNYIENESEVEREDGSTPLRNILQLEFSAVDWISVPYRTASKFLTFTALQTSEVPTIEPFALENLLYTKTNKDADTVLLKKESSTQSKDQLSWGIIRSDEGSVEHPCLNYGETYPQGSEEFFSVRRNCFLANIYQSILYLMRCAYRNQTSSSLTWSTVPSAYFHSQCLCLAYNGTECSVKAPRGVDARPYCLSLLIRDFQRQVRYRPAVTYLDYASQTRIPVCQFVHLLEVGFRSECEYFGNIDLIISSQCYFKGLVNKQLNCSETLRVDTYNVTELCALQTFMEFVLCEGNDEVLVPYHWPGGSTLVLVLTYLEVAVRVFTLVTYLACPELRNLPGKLLIGYQVTALLRILVVRASLEDLALAVRLDVATDLASTLWLTSYLHFLTESIKALRLPDSLSPVETLMVLLRYALLGWALPVVLSAAFFSMDEALDTRVQFGQLLFVLCHYVALFGNIFMFIQNCLFYHDIKSSAIKLRKDAGARSVFVDLFIFALKTSLLSGAGITFRLVFTQIQGLEDLLDYYHALSTLQGLLFFVLYGCNREGRAFWNLVVFTKLPRWLSRQRTTP